MTPTVILRKEGEWKATTNPILAKALLKQGWSPVARTDSPQQAQQMIVGLRSAELVEKLLPHLTEHEQIIVKTEISSIATEYHNNMNLL